jgi:hypothetical protein
MDSVEKTVLICGPWGCRWRPYWGPLLGLAPPLLVGLASAPLVGLASAP